MEMNALRGIVKDGAGTTSTTTSPNSGWRKSRWIFCWARQGPLSKARSWVLRAIEDNLLGESMSDVHALVSRSLRQADPASKTRPTSSTPPPAHTSLRQDVRRNFTRGHRVRGICEQSLSRPKRPERLVPANEGIAFPLGDDGHLHHLWRPGQPAGGGQYPRPALYARQHLDEKGRWIDLMTEASILPVNNGHRDPHSRRTDGQSSWPASSRRYGSGSMPTRPWRRPLSGFPPQRQRNAPSASSAVPRTASPD